MSSLRDFSRSYNKNDVVPTLEAMQKIIAFYHDKDIGLLKLGCTSPNLTHNCLHKSTDADFYQFTEGDKDLKQIFRDVVGGSSVVFTRQACIDETFIWNSTNMSERIVGIDANELYSYSMSQPTSTGLHTRYDLEWETKRFSHSPKQNQKLRKNGQILSPTKKNRLKNWKPL